MTCKWREEPKNLILYTKLYKPSYQWHEKPNIFNTLHEIVWKNAKIDKWKGKREDIHKETRNCQFTILDPRSQRAGSYKFGAVIDKV